MPSQKRLEIAASAAIGDFHFERYEIMARCSCGHQRELRGEFIRRVIGLQTTIGTLQCRLRCHKCGGRTAKVDVYRRLR